jgi:hypothetical protein
MIKIQTTRRKLTGDLKLIEFANPPGHFKADIRGDYVNISLIESKRGNESTKHSTKAALSILDDAVNITPEEFRARLEQFLSKRGFQLISGTG